MMNLKDQEGDLPDIPEQVRDFGALRAANSQDSSLDSSVSKLLFLDSLSALFYITLIILFYSHLVL